MPLLPGTGLLSDAAQARAEASRIGYPVMLKSTAGGGGIGMRLVWSETELSDAFASVGRVGVGPLAGELAETIGWPTCFILSTVAAVPALWMLWAMRATVRQLEADPAHARADD